LAQHPFDRQEVSNLRGPMAVRFHDADFPRLQRLVLPTGARPLPVLPRRLTIIFRLMVLKNLPNIIVGDHSSPPSSESFFSFAADRNRQSLSRNLHLKPTSCPSS